MLVFMIDDSCFYQNRFTDSLNSIKNREIAVCSDMIIHKPTGKILKDRFDPRPKYRPPEETKFKVDVNNNIFTFEGNLANEIASRLDLIFKNEKTF